jgi:Bifunctional DNA primase/polymerase, N-terminal/AAA domain
MLASCGSVRPVSSFLDIALPLAERGFRAFPLIPGQKRPLPMAGDYDHFDTATTDAGQIESWSKQEPSANVGIAPDEIFCFLETDAEHDLKEACADLPPEIWDTARVSARPDRSYYIFRQTMRTKRAGNMTVTREGKENLFEFKQHRLYVVGPGSIHPKTGQPYGVEWRTIPAMPDVLLNRLCELYGAPKATSAGVMSEDAKCGTAKLDDFLACYEVSVTGEWFNKGQSWYRPIECPWLSGHENANQGTSTCVVYTEGSGYGFDCKHRCAGKGWKEFRAFVMSRHPEKQFSFVNNLPEVVLCSVTEEKKITDWRTRYHTFDEMENAPKPSFLIDGFLQKDVITAIAAPVGQRKTIVACNAVHAVLTGKPLFDHFPVTQRAERVLYLCPEMGLLSFADRMRNLGLLPYVGKTLFCRTMNSEGHLTLTDLTTEELEGAVVVIDTAVRFVIGDENSSEDMKVFAADCFGLMKSGAASVIVLFHSPKGTKEASELTLENAMRGSGDLGAFVSSCWATRLQDPDNDEWKSPSYMKNVKQRDFKSKPFEVTSDELGKLHIVAPPSVEVTLNTKQAGTPVNADGKEEAVLQFIRDHPKLSNKKTEAELKKLGIPRSATWVGNKKYELFGTGCQTGPE